MIKNIVTNLFLLFTAINFGSCSSSSDNDRRSNEEIKAQIDSVQLKQNSLSYIDGKQLFSKYCNTCHVAPEKDVLDQYLFDNIFERLPSSSEDYFVKYISDSKSLKKSGNEYANQVDQVWDQDYEHKFKDSLSAKDFSSLINYIKIGAKQRYQNQGG